MNNSLMDVTTSGHSGTILMDDDPKEASADGGVSPTTRIVVICMLAVFSVIGTVGNALAIYVFASLKQKLRHTNSMDMNRSHIVIGWDKRLTSTVFILTLAGTDFLTCLITIPFTIYMEYVNHYANNDVECKIFTFLSTTTVPFSAVVMVAIAVDRYMCICHPFNHWMTIQRARIIIGILVVFIFMFGGIICLHHTIYFPMTVNDNTTAAILAQNSIGGGIYESIANGTLGLYNTVAFNGSGNYNSAVAGGLAYSSSSNETTALGQAGKERAVVINNSQCDIKWDFIDTKFMKIFRSLYTAIFAVSCIIVLILYSLIYRYVISQRKKKLRIKSAQCCLLWNATSVETPHEAVEMTQDIELSNVNGDRYNARLNSADDANESHNNVAARKCSISKARIERMRVANIKTAFTLFIVTLVFIIAFLPAWLMALKMLDMQVILFYMHFSYNVSNPFIYAFLNQNFKAELRRIARCGKH